MYLRPFWIDKINMAWQKRPIVWLSGVRRAGKTTIAKMLSPITYLNCDLPSVGRTLAEPELFYDTLPKDAIVVFDEIHKLEDPSRILKIAADVYPHLRILATGSSTLEATHKFRDSLTGRKQTIFLPPVLWYECQTQFNIKDLDHRLLQGGLPESLLTIEKDPSFYSEWIDSFYARDIQELFGIRNRTGFLKLLNLLLRTSGGVIDYTNLAKLSDLSRLTVKSHIEAMRIAHAVFLLPPFHGGGRREITQRPKCYAFDTGFVTFLKGWDNIRDDDRGYLWEHLVLDTLRSIFNDNNLYYWRDKSGHEVDFAVKGIKDEVNAIECKINPDQFGVKQLIAFRTVYPKGKNFVVSPFVKTPYERHVEKLLVRFSNLDQFCTMA